MSKEEKAVGQDVATKSNKIEVFVRVDGGLMQLASGPFKTKAEYHSALKKGLIDMDTAKELAGNDNPSFVAIRVVDERTITVKTVEKIELN